MGTMLKTKTEKKPSLRPPLGLLLLVTAFCGMVASACDTGKEGDVASGGYGDTDADGDTDGDGDTNTDRYATALVITSDQQTGAYATMALDGHAVNKDIRFIHSDAVCRFDPLTDTPFILMRLGSDAVDVLDPGSFDIVTEYSVEPASNPQDIAVISDERAYVSRYNSAEMLIVNPFTGAQIGTVNLSRYADADGIPEVSGLAQMNGKVYANVQRLDRENGWEPVGDGYVVIIDADTGAVEGDVRVSGANPSGAPELSEVLQKLVLAEPGSFSTLDDGGIELFDPETNTVSGFLVTEATLGGSVTKGLLVSETKGYAIVGVAGENASNTHLVTFNPQNGTKTGTLAEGEGWVYGDIELTPDTTALWLTDRTAERSGIRIFDTATDAEKTKAPINVGLPPSDICFTR